MRTLVSRDKKSLSYRKFKLVIQKYYIVCQSTCVYNRWLRHFHFLSTVAHNIGRRYGYFPSINEELVSKKIRWLPVRIVQRCDVTRCLSATERERENILCRFHNVVMLYFRWARNNMHYQYVSHHALLWDWCVELGSVSGQHRVS